MSNKSPQETWNELEDKVGDLLVDLFETNNNLDKYQRLAGSESVVIKTHREIMQLLHSHTQAGFEYATGQDILTDNLIGDDLTRAQGYNDAKFHIRKRTDEWLLGSKENQ